MTIIPSLPARSTSHRVLFRGALMLLSLLTLLTCVALIVMKSTDLVSPETREFLNRLPNTTPRPQSVTIETFVRLTKGMSHNDVVKLFGWPGIERPKGVRPQIVETGLGEFSIPEVRDWSSPQATITVTFVKDRLWTKTQSGLQSGPK
jgi:hypothetical protein